MFFLPTFAILFNEREEVHNISEGSIAQLVQSVCLTSRGSGVRLPLLPPNEKRLCSNLQRRFSLSGPPFQEGPHLLYLQFICNFQRIFMRNLYNLSIYKTAFDSFAWHFFTNNLYCVILFAIVLFFLLYLQKHSNKWQL